MTAVRKEEETKEMGKIIGICISEKRGTAKHEVETAKLVEDWGIEGDAHAGLSSRSDAPWNADHRADVAAHGISFNMGNTDRCDGCARTVADETHDE